LSNDHHPFKKKNAEARSVVLTAHHHSFRKFFEVPVTFLNRPLARVAIDTSSRATSTESGAADVTAALMLEALFS